MGSRIRIVIADDHGLFREMLRLTLRREGGIKIVGEAVNVRQTIDVISELKPDIVLLDSTILENEDIEVLPEIREKNQNTKALMLTANKDEATIFKALRGGSQGIPLEGCKHLRSHQGDSGSP